MYSFKNDYSEGAHPQILQALVETNMEQCDGYGLDSYCMKAAGILREKISAPDADVHFFSGGTATNLCALASFLRPHEAVISAESGHIQTHETGAIEATGHQILCLPSEDGKIQPQQMDPIIAEHNFEHMVKPRLVYISNPTEFGTIYSKDELRDLKNYCEENELLLYIDGARLGTALTAKANDVALSDLPKLCDAFYIGGTKNGALLGEALVINNPSVKRDFRYIIKQRGALLAKGRLIGIQFLTLFQDDLFYTLGEHANKMAQKMASEMKALGVEFQIDSPTNQIFPILDKTVISQLEKSYDFYVWSNLSETKASIRLVTSWATDESVIDAFIADFQKVVSL